MLCGMLLWLIVFLCEYAQHAHGLLLDAKLCALVRWLAVTLSYSPFFAL